MQVTALATRQPKERDVGHSELLARWRSRAEEIGLNREEIARTFDAEAALRIERRDAPLLSEAQLCRAVTAAASHFDRREAIQAVADSLRQGASGAEVERLTDAFLASDSVIQIAEGAKGPRYTTRRIWELEREALAAAQRMRAQGLDPAGELVAARVIGARPTLKADQREMVRRLLSGSEGVAVVIGEAGTGKTFAIVAAAEGWAEAGIELRAAAPTWRAANVMRAEGLPASSIASLLLALDRTAHEGDEGLPRGSVLLVDEAGMVDSATLARLVSHAERAQAKLVLVGDPEQLGEIEAGGLFRALAERGEPIHLDEVIRHRHELDREAAKRIREGEGREAFSLYQSQERVTVAPNAEERREAMVRDWHEAYERGEDAMMVAKQNAEVRRLNEIAREVRRQGGQLEAQEIEVGEATFAAGDLVITRVNDPRAEIFNRERWQIAEVDAVERRMTLEGIDQAKAVEVGADYLARSNRDAPALEHAYAVTTYSAQGTTIDRAFVAADPSMDKQELYVAASRSREETFIYAMPEIQTHREEIAPESPHLREGIPHITEAAERDRAQLAAHDEALRSKFSGLPTEELIARRDELRAAARREDSMESQRRSLQQRIERAREHIEGFEAEREAAQALPRRERRDELTRIDSWEARSRRETARLEAELADMPVAEQAARRELAVADQVLARRRELAIIAARISPPAYVKNELGERPSDPAMRKAWDRGVSQIERYRQEHGVTDPNKALGREAKRGAERARQQATWRRIQEAQRALGLGQHAARARQLGRGLSIGR